MTIFHRLQGSLVIFFSFFLLFYLLQRNLILTLFMLQADITIRIEIQYIWDQPELQLLRVGPDLYSLKMPDNLPQYRGRPGPSNSRSIVNRSKFNNFITLKDRNNNNVACSLISVLFVSLFSVLFFLKDNVSKNSRQFLVSILFSSTTLLIPFFFFFQSSSTP